MSIFKNYTRHCLLFEEDIEDDFDKHCDIDGRDFFSFLNIADFIHPFFRRSNCPVETGPQSRLVRPRGKIKRGKN